MGSLFLLELFAVSMGLLFIILLITENIWCWSFGILSSIAYIFLMYFTMLYSESLLYVFYVAIGIYGWKQWSKSGKQKVNIQNSSVKHLAILTVLAVGFSYSLGYYFSNYTDASRPYADASTTVFSVIASYMEANKWLVAWVFWIVINAFSIWLYFDRSLNLSSFLMLIYFLLSVFGFIQWRKKLIMQESNSE